MKRECYVYILASYKNGTLYTGITNDLFVRVRQIEKDNPQWSELFHRLEF